MSTDATDREVDRYLSNLNRSLSDLPHGKRQEIIEDITEHIRLALEELGESSVAQVREVLDRVGDPDAIAAEARSRLGIPQVRPTALEPIAIALLLFGGFLMGVGWLAGVVLLWMSPVWSRRHKLLGSLLVPGGLASALFVFAIPGQVSYCSTISGPATVQASGSPVSPPPFATPPSLNAVTQCASSGPGTLTKLALLALIVLIVVGSTVSAVILGRRVGQARRAVDVSRRFA
ncbi:MAG: hypothetical protein WDA71_09900 [Actinomycetota bacterium]